MGQHTSYTIGPQTLPAHARVFLDAGTLRLAGEDELEVGVIPRVFNPHREASVIGLAPGDRETFIASEAIPAGNDVFRGANGTVAASGSSRIGTALGTAAAAGDYVQLVVTPSTGGGGGPGGDPTNISVTPAPDHLTIVSSTGSDGNFPLVTDINAGAMPPGYKATIDFITVTTNVDLDIINGLKHPAATGSNAIDVTVGQVVSLIASPDVGNLIQILANGVFVAPSSSGSYTQVANLAARGAVVAGARVKVATNQLIYVGYGGQWVPERLDCVVDGTTFGAMSEHEENQFVVDVEGPGTYAFTYSAENGLKGCFGINGQTAALRIPVYTVTATDIANGWAMILEENQAMFVQVQFGKFLVALDVDATFTPATGVLEWNALALDGVIEAGDILRGIYWA